MDEFLNRLAEMKWNYYTYLFVIKPTAQTIEECNKRIESQIRYEQILEIIDWLPKEEKEIVENRFNHLKNL